MSAAKVELGRRLFYDADLSSDGTMACATCHEQKHAFTDGNTTHPGVTGEPGRRNVPGLANVAWNSPLTLADPAQTSLERQLAVPVLGTHPIEMGMKGREGDIATRLSHDSCYRSTFAQAFADSGGRIDFGNIARAIAGFERTLTSYDRAYDRDRMSPEARVGPDIFARECASCHAGVRFTDLAYHRPGLVVAGAADRGWSKSPGNPKIRAIFARRPSAMSR